MNKTSSLLLSPEMGWDQESLDVVPRGRCRAYSCSAQPPLPLTATCEWSGCYPLPACFQMRKWRLGEARSPPKVDSKWRAELIAPFPPEGCRTTGASHHLPNCLPTYPPSFCRGGVRGTQDRVLLQAVWAVLHQRGDGEDKPLSQCCPLQEFTGNHGPGPSVPGTGGLSSLLFWVSLSFHHMETWLHQAAACSGCLSGALRASVSMVALNTFCQARFFVPASPTILSDLSSCSPGPWLGWPLSQGLGVPDTEISLTFCYPVRCPSLLD